MNDKYKVKWSSRFKKDYKLAIKRGYNIKLIDDVIRLIAKGNEQQKLIEEYDVLVLNLSRIGTHSDLCKK